MNSSWQSFLLGQGATENEAGIPDFSQDTADMTVALSENVICYLNHLGLICATGSDASNFLQGQFSNDVTLLQPEKSQLSSYNSPKGRMLALFRLSLAADGQYFLQLPSDILESTLKRLRMFVMRSEVTLEDASDQWIQLGFSGAGVEEKLKTVFGDIPREVDAVVYGEDYQLIRLPGKLPRFVFYASEARAEQTWLALGEICRPVPAAAWRLLEIENGIPSVHQQTQEAFVPQMANLHSLGGVSFTKGCYTGQEIVARMHYLGKQKRRMYLADIAQDEIIPGMAVHVLGGDGQSVGSVVDAVARGDGVSSALLVLQTQAAEQSLCLEETAPATIKLRDLPYEVALEGENKA